MEHCGERYEQDSHDDLEDQRRLDKGMARLNLAICQRLICRVRCTPAVQCLDDAGDEPEGRQNSAGVEGRVIGDVVEDSAEDMVVL